MKSSAMPLVLLFGALLFEGCSTEKPQTLNETVKQTPIETVKQTLTETVKRTPTETVKGFNNAMMKEESGLDEAVEYCTKRAGEGFRYLYRIAKSPIQTEGIEYGEEEIVGDTATVMTKFIKKIGGKEETIPTIFHLEIEDGEWGVVGIQQNRKIFRFDSFRRNK